MTCITIGVIRRDYVASAPKALNYRRFVFHKRPSVEYPKKNEKLNIIVRYPVSMTLNILGAKVKVITVKDLDHRGEADFENNLIKLRAGMKPKERKQALHHEIMHWTLYRSGLAEGMSHIVNEAICDAHGFVYSENKSI